MPTFDTIRTEADNRLLVRKIQKAAAFIAPLTVPTPTTLFGTGGTLIDLKTLGWLPVGMVTPDGYTFGRDISKEDVNALGYASAVRSDISTVARTVSFTALEKGKKHMYELAYGANYSAVVQTLANGEVVLQEPDLPVGQEYRLLVIGSDGPATANWIFGKCYPTVKLANTGEETWGQEGAVQLQYTLDVYTDQTLGVPVLHFMGGTGAVAQKTVTGFTQGA